MSGKTPANQRWVLLFQAALLLPFPVANAEAQTAPQIIDRHVKARGGAKALKAIRSVRLRGTIQGGGEFLWLTKAPSAFYLETRHGDTHAVEAFNGKSAWREDTAGGARTLSGDEQSRARATGVHRSDHFLNYKKDKIRLNLLGRDPIDGRAAYAIEVTTPTGIRRKVFVDAQTFLILKEEQPRDGGTEEIFFADYRAVDGVQEPGRIRIRRGAETLDLIVAEAVHNAVENAALFDFPRRDGAPFPDVDTLFKALVENQKRLETLREQYTYTKTETDVQLDGHGRVKERRERTYEVFYADGEPVETLIATNGRPLSEDEAGRERERVQKKMRERKENIQKAGERRARNEPKGAKKEGDGELTILQILHVCQFVNPRRERFRGKDVLIYDFEARPGAKPRSRGESWMRKLEGNVWIDESAKEVVRAEARTIEPIKMAGGLVLSLQRGSSFVIEQAPVNDEVWLPSSVEVNAAARVLLVKGFKIHQTQRFRDYKKFGVETSAEIALPETSPP